MTTTTINPGDNVQKKINAAKSGDTVSFAGATFDVNTSYKLKSGLHYVGNPGTVMMSHGVPVFEGQSVHTIDIHGFLMDGMGTGPQSGGAVYIYPDDNLTPSRSIRVRECTFQNWLNRNNAGAVINFWDTGDGCYVQGNKFNNILQAINFCTNPGQVELKNIVASDNEVVRCKAIAMETGWDSDVTSVHFDRNKFSQLQAMSISLVSFDTGGHFKSGTVWGNQITGMGIDKTLGIVEIGSNPGFACNITMSQNLITDMKWGSMFAHAQGLVVQNNDFERVKYPFGDDGGYDRTEWVGWNTVNGKNMQGWTIIADDEDGKPHIYGARPPVFSPSKKYVPLAA